MNKIIFWFLTVFCSLILVGCGYSDVNDEDSKVNQGPLIQNEAIIYVDVFDTEIDFFGGITIKDDHDGDISLDSAEVELNNFNSSILGTYTISVTIADSKGVVSKKDIEVHVVDKVPPTIDLIGEQEIFLYSGIDYTESGLSMADNYDDEMVVDVFGTVDTSIPGTYTIRYSVTDSSGNVSELLTRDVVILDNFDFELLNFSKATYFVGDYVVGHDINNDAFQITSLIDETNISIVPSLLKEQNENTMIYIADSNLEAGYITVGIFEDNEYHQEFYDLTSTNASSNVLLPILDNLQHSEIVNDYLVATTKEGNLFIYDILNEEIKDLQSDRSHFEIYFDQYITLYFEGKHSVVDIESGETIFSTNGYSAEPLNENAEYFLARNGMTTDIYKDNKVVHRLNGSYILYNARGNLVSLRNYMEGINLSIVLDLNTFEILYEGPGLFGEFTDNVYYSLIEDYSNRLFCDLSFENCTEIRSIASTLRLEVIANSDGVYVSRYNLDTLLDFYKYNNTTHRLDLIESEDSSWDLMVFQDDNSRRLFKSISLIDKEWVLIDLEGNVRYTFSDELDFSRDLINIYERDGYIVIRFKTGAYLLTYGKN